MTLAGRDVHVGVLRGSGVRTSMLVVAVLFVHSIPEGFAIGTAYASERQGLGLFIVLAIALQNVPEGTTSAIPMHDAGFSRWQQFWAAVLTSAPQPVGAIAAYLLVEEIDSLLPVSFAFAAGAMLSLVAVEIVPQAFTRATWRDATAGARRRRRAHARAERRARRLTLRRTTEGDRASAPMAGARASSRLRAMTAAAPPRPTSPPVTALAAVLYAPLLRRSAR